jgi:hypothetical protein
LNAVTKISAVASVALMPSILAAAPLCHRPGMSEFSCFECPQQQPPFNHFADVGRSSSVVSPCSPRGSQPQPAGSTCA